MTSHKTNSSPLSAGPDGMVLALLAFGIWGLAPLFWAQLLHISAFEILAHRVLWASVLSWVALLATGRVHELQVLRSGRALGAVAASTVLIAINWLVFIWAVQQRRVTEISVGYYTNPLYNVLLGRLVLGELLSQRKVIAVFLASTGVLYLALSLQTLPWVSLVLASSFGTYGLVRKLAPMPALSGLAVETTACAPLCALFLLTQNPVGGHVATQPSDFGWLVLGGAITAAPLLLFASAARKLPYATLGMTQYVAPTLQLVVACLALGEPFTAHHGLTFAFIWAGVLLFLFDRIVPRGATFREHERGNPVSSDSISS